jgi:hypothetical protein
MLDRIGRFLRKAMSAVRPAGQTGMSFSFDEAKHPRGQGGKFSQGGGGGTGGGGGLTPSGRRTTGTSKRAQALAAGAAANKEWTAKHGRGETTIWTEKDLRDRPATTLLERIAAATPFMDVQAMWALTDDEVSQVRQEAVRDGNEALAMMVDIHRNVRARMSAKEREDARGVIIGSVRQERDRRMRKAVGQLGFSFGEVGARARPGSTARRSGGAKPAAGIAERVGGGERRLRGAFAAGSRWPVTIDGEFVSISRSER